jgi:hypothetical protein
MAWPCIISVRRRPAGRTEAREAQFKYYFATNAEFMRLGRKLQIKRKGWVHNILLVLSE